MRLPRMNTYQKYTVPVLGVGLGLLILLWLSNRSDLATPTEAPQAIAALSVSTVKPQQARLPITIPATGNIAAWQESIIGAEVNGLLLKEVLVNVGDSVKKGQLLARFSTSNIEADIAQAQANVAEAKANEIEASSNASRARSIQHTGALSAQQIAQYITAESSAKARADAAVAGLNVHQVKLKQTAVYAPDSGIISARNATVGNVASAGQELFKLIRQGRLEWRAELTSADINRIKVGMPAHLTLPDGQQLQGTVRTFSPNVDTQTRNAMAYVDIQNQFAKAGMFARGQFNLDDSPAIMLPNSAIVMRDGFAYVMQVKASTDLNSHSVKQVKVMLGRRHGYAVEVLDLQALDANYVKSGGAFLVDGDSVKVVATPAAHIAK